MITIIWQILSSGLQVLRTDYPILLILVLTSILPFGLWVALMLYRFCSVHDAAILFSSGLCGGLIFDALISLVLLIVFPGAWLKEVFLVAAILVWIIDIILCIRWHFLPKGSLAVYGLILLFLFLVILRLAFISGLFLPLYTDSIQHYAIIQDLVTDRQPPENHYNLSAFPHVYYHYGYHSLSARLIVLGAFDAARSMLVLGQIFLTVAAVGLYFPVALLTRSRLAAFITVFLSGLLWVMPAYAINWGKYPALAAMAAFPFVIGSFVLFLQPGYLKARWPIGVLVALGSLGCLMIHTRITIILMIVGIAYGISNIVFKKNYLPLAVLFGIGILLSVLNLSGFIQIGEGFEIYWRYGFEPLLIALLGSILCYLKYPHLAFTVLLVIALALGAWILPLPSVFAGFHGLLDRPFFQISLFIPLSILTGSGLAALINCLRPNWLKVILTTVMCVGLLFFAPLAQTTRPSSCCQLAGSDDLFVYQWLENQALSEDRILIAAYQSPFRLIESDGGAWVEALTLRSTEKIVNTIDFSSPDQQKALCAAGINYVYAGSSPYSFDRSALAAQPDIYVPEIQLPQVSLYRLNCDE